MMTCDELEQVLVDAARGGALAGVSLDHVARCARCADRVAARAAVADALGMLAEADADRGAPARVESAVLAVWRARQPAREPRREVGLGQRDRVRVDDKAPVDAHVPVEVRMAASAAGAMDVPVPVDARMPDGRAGAVRAATSDVTRRAMRWRGAATAAAVAAMTIAIVSLSLYVSAMRKAEMPRREDRSIAARTSGTDARQAPVAAIASDAAADRSEDAEALDRPRARAGARRARSSSLATGVARPRAANPAVPSDPANGIVAFTAFPYAEPLRPTEMRQVVRVAVPHTTVMLAGLSTQGVSDRWPADVLADVLVGEDGVARGIRLVAIAQ